VRVPQLDEGADELQDPSARTSSTSRANEIPAASEAGLTTIHRDFVDEGQAAAQMLIDNVAGRPRKTSVPTFLVVRASTGPPAKTAPRQSEPPNDPAERPKP
jgi:hypothetical protein